MSIESVMPSNHLILCRPLLLPPVFPSIRVFSNESALCLRWPKCWSFSFNISSSNEHPGLISLRMDWSDTGSKLEKEYIKAVYCHPAYLSYMQSTSCEMPAWMRHKLESRFLGEISITSGMQMTPPLWQTVKSN